MKLKCDDCNRVFSLIIREADIRPGLKRGDRFAQANPLFLKHLIEWRVPYKGDTLPETRHCWTVELSDHRHDYVISPDWIYGRRWLLQIDVLRSGFWLFRGSFWTLYGARRAAGRFTRWWATILTHPDDIRKFRIPGSVTELAYKHASGRTTHMQEQIDGGPLMPRQGVR